MGFPVGNISALSAVLGVDHPNPRVIERMRRQLRQNYDRIAVILHDPSSHITFSERLDSTLLDLDQQTGERTAFFFLGGLPRAWQDRLPRHLRRLQELGLDWFTPEVRDSGAAVFYLAMHLGIPGGSLPAIIVLDAWSDTVRFARTDERVLAEQLRTLGEDPAQERPDWRQYGGPRLPRWRNLKYGRSRLAAALVNLSPVAGRTAVDRILVLERRASSAREHVRVTERGTAAVEEAAFLYCVHHVQGEPNHRVWSQIRHRPWEPMALRSLRTCFAIHERLHGLEYDPAAVVAPLMRGLEREINLSVVQWIRQLLGVSMPEYFARHQPGVTAVYGSDTKQPTLFNRKKSSAWLPPPMGSTIFVAGKLAPPHAPPAEWAESEWPAFLGQFEPALRLRNDAAHPNEFEAHRINEAFDWLGRFDAQGETARMFGLKHRLRGSREPSIEEVAEAV